MRVLITSHSGQLGGMELRMADEARQLRALGHEPIMAPRTFEGSEPWLRALQAEGLRIERWEPPSFFETWQGRRMALLKAWALHRQPLRRWQVDLVHVAFAWTEQGGTRLWLASRAGLPSVVSVHNAFPPQTFAPWTARRAREAFSGVRGLYGVSASALAHFLALYEPYLPPKVVCRAIPNFVDVARFVPAPEQRAQTRAALGVPGDALLVGSIGRLDEQKEPLHLVRCFARALPHLQQPAYLLFVGQGNLEAALRRELHSLGIADRVLLRPFTPQPEHLFPALDLHVLLSKQEGFGITTAEAMACGVPVLGTDVPGTRDVLGGTEAGWLVPYGDEAATADAVVRVLNDTAAREAAAIAGVEVVRQRYAKPIWEAAIADFYAAAISVARS